ncbi:uncharacterized protein LOC108104402 [Drosophila eugracilis]|uniref:uncharacterized protein LOC108104402 n=1 Tax=Drosophila eugracilis TaxID=29029 RepID=UPI0007E65864|nr:uncharacterized protein LOC108104402 [Drosophila eugracilis]
MMPPLQRDQFNHQHFVQHFLQRQKIGNFDINYIYKTTSPITNSKVRTKNRFRTSSSSTSSRNNIHLNSRSNERHFHLSETPDLLASSSLLSSAFVASSAALVNVTCQAEEGQSSAGSHSTVLRGNDAGISFAALDFRFIRKIAIIKEKSKPKILYKKKQNRVRVR